MKHYLKPNLELSPAQVVLHVGTNEPQQLAESTVDLARRIQLENPSEVTVASSELVPRWDEFNDGVKTANKHVRNYCRQNGWKLIQHQNTLEKELKRGGLHFNFRCNQQFLSIF